MRKFLAAACLLLAAQFAAADDLPVIAGLKAFRAPMERIVAEGAKGRDADLAAISAAYADADKAWKLATGEPMDMEAYGIPAERQEEAWREVRMMGMLVGYLDEAVKRGDRTLMLRAAGLLQPAYDKLAARLGIR
ncbi:MAG: hypothetical protein OEL88_09895 [Sterolibacteriaceae bacterium MAG5]|nr:hypothetical protein [Candidatus Nitricoxidireducens bremensis]